MHRQDGEKIGATMLYLLLVLHINQIPILHMLKESVWREE